MCRSSSNYHTAVCNILKHPFIPSSCSILSNLQHILDLNLAPTGGLSLISARFASWVHHHRGDPNQSAATNEDNLPGVLDTNEVRFGSGLFPGANLSWPSLWWERPRRTHSQSRFAWSCPDTRLRLSPWTMWPERWRNTPWAVGIKQTCIRHTPGDVTFKGAVRRCVEMSRVRDLKNKRESGNEKNSSTLSSCATLTACTELQSRLVSRYRSARFSSSLSFESAWWEDKHSGFETWQGC